MIVFTTIFFS